MPSRKAVECFFHPNKLNSSWCVKCGKPICHECDTHSIFVVSGYSICPPCKSRQVYIISAITIPCFTFLTILCSLFLGYGEMIFPFLISIGVLIFFIIFLILDVKNRKIWEQTCDNFSDFKGTLSDIIKYGIIPCEYHLNSPSIGICDVCGTEICLKCSRVKGRTRYSPAQFLCIGHYWKKQGRSILIISIVLLALSLLPIILTILFGSSLLAPLFFGLGIPLLISFSGVYFYYNKIKWDFQHWQEEIGFQFK